MKTERARSIAEGLLAEPLPQRWAHTQGVARRARELGERLDVDVEMVEAAAWLHDIGYAPSLAATGLHALDGARYLRDVVQASGNLCVLVAHHSGAVYEAEERGLVPELLHEFGSDPDTAISRVLTTCDMTTSPKGVQEAADRRIAEILERYRPDSAVHKAVTRSADHLLRVVRDVEGPRPATGDRLQRLDRASATFVEDFTGDRLDQTRWIDQYLPQWTTPDRSRARYDLVGAQGFPPGSGGGLRLRIDADQPDWRPEDAPLRVSNLQTAAFAGPLGSTRGTHRHRPDGLTVRTHTPEQMLWAPRAGRVDITVTASQNPGCMLAAWLVGTEHLDDQDSGEICLFEIDADAVIGPTTRARTGVKAHHDPRLVTDMREVDVAVGVGQAHTWSANWGATGVAIACDFEVIFSSGQVLDYPVQLMVDLFEIGPRDAPGAFPKTATIHSVLAT